MCPDNLTIFCILLRLQAPIDYLKIPIQTLKVGASGTHNRLGLAKAKGARMLVASTSEAYNWRLPNVHPQTEEYWGNVNPVSDREAFMMKPSDLWNLLQGLIILSTV
jgi:dTDP-glucose 4,6-dehydratase